MVGFCVLDVGADGRAGNFKTIKLGRIKKKTLPTVSGIKYNIIALYVCVEARNVSNN